MPDPRLITFTPADGSPTLQYRKPDSINDAQAGVIEMRWDNFMRHELDTIRSVASREVAQFRNRQGYYRCVCSIGTKLLTLTFTERTRFGPDVERTRVGVLQLATANMERGVERLSLMFYDANDVYITGTGELLVAPL